MVYELYPGRTEQRKGREGGRKGEEETITEVGDSVNN